MMFPSVPLRAYTLKSPEPMIMSGILFPSMSAIAGDERNIWPMLLFHSILPSEAVRT